MAKILLVDDHAMLRDAISMALRNLGNDVKIEGVGDGEKALAWIETHGQPDLVLLDVRLPDGNGITLLKTLRRRYVGLKVAMLSGEDDMRTVQEALSAGAIGFLTKTAGTDLLVTNVREFLHGVRSVSSSHVDWIAQGPEGDVKTIGERFGLTKTQSLILEYLTLGWRNRKIAERLEIAEGTVKAHTSAIFKCFNVGSRSELLVRVREVS
ncbi:MAG: response regulator transcription factor [Sulfuritalea sp.]|nr:response regulator transcription factor [Sulfuritalea sp.]